MLINAHAVTPAAPRSTCAEPNSPGTANANAVAIGASAAMASSTADPPVRGRRSSAAATVRTASTLSA